MSMKRYELPTPPAGKLTDLAAWQESVDNSQAQLEHQSLRILNLELMSEYGAAAWRSHNSVLAKMIESSQRHLQVSLRIRSSSTSILKKIFRLVQRGSNHSPFALDASIIPL